MNGHEYEYACAQYLKKTGYSNVNVTKASGDQGIDVIAYKNGKKYGIQCKYYAKPVGNKAVQEAFSGAEFYGCDISAVMTNTAFTKSAKALAKKLGVELWDHKDEKLIKRMKLNNSHGVTISKLRAFFQAALSLCSGFFGFMCLIASLCNHALDVELLVYTILFFLLCVFFVYLDTWSAVCNRNSKFLNQIGIKESEWKKSSMTSLEMRSLIFRVKTGKEGIDKKQRKKCYQVEAALCNAYNTMIDEYYNKHPDASIDEKEYICPER